MEDEPINIIGCDTIVNSPSYFIKHKADKYFRLFLIQSGTLFFKFLERFDINHITVFHYFLSMPVQ
jgi:hypothetical protein